MKYKIKFYRKMMEISVTNGEITYYYSDLMFVKYDEPYCILHFADSAKHRVEVSLNYLLENLPKKPFFRCNRTNIINICYYGRYQEKPPILFLKNGTQFILSVRKISDFKKQKANMDRISPPCPSCKVCNSKNCPDYNTFCISSKLMEDK